jgi:hypothetical protein
MGYTVPDALEDNAHWAPAAKTWKEFPIIAFDEWVKETEGWMPRYGHTKELG